MPRTLSTAIRGVADIDPDGKVDGNRIEAAAQRCVTRAVAALEGPLPHYTELQRAQMRGLFKAMKRTLRTIRRILGAEAHGPGSIDALALARLPIESLFSLCLMIQDPKWAQVYVWNGWESAYKRFLLEREERNHLPRFQPFLGAKGPTNLSAWRNSVGLTPAHQDTIDQQELGRPLPAGTKPAPIPAFPTPARSLREIVDPLRRRGLCRLYVEYVRHCSFIHLSAEAVMLSEPFDPSSPFSNLYPSSEREETWLKEVGELAFVMGPLSIAYSAAELTVLYPADIELKRAAVEAWNLLAAQSLLTKILWQIRVERLLGIVRV